MGIAFKVSGDTKRMEIDGEYYEVLQDSEITREAKQSKKTSREIEIIHTPFGTITGEKWR